MPGGALHSTSCSASSSPSCSVAASGTQLAALDYPHLGHTEILGSVDDFYKRFYFRAPKIAEMSLDALFALQVLVKAEQAKSLAKYFAEIGKPQPVDGSWPLKPWAGDEPDPEPSRPLADHRQG